MNWTKDKSVKLSLVCVWVFAAALLTWDIFAVKIATYLWGRFSNFFNVKTLYLAVIYTGSVFGWICLWNLRRLLKNIQAGELFTEENVSILRRVSWCCAGASIVTFGLGIVRPGYLIFAIAAAFMMLIVRIVKNAFRQALDMKSELDLTI